MLEERDDLIPDPDQLDLLADLDADLTPVPAPQRDPRFEQVLEPEEFDRRCLEHHADGLSLQEIADQMAADGVLTWHQGEFRAPGKQKIWRAVTRATEALVAETLASESDKAVQVLRANRRVARTTKRLRSLMAMREAALAATDKHGNPKPDVSQVLSIDFAITQAEKMLVEADTMLTTLTGHMVQRSEQKLTVEAKVTHEDRLMPSLQALKALNAAEMDASERLALERFARDTDQLELIEGEVIEAEVVEGRER